MSEAAARSGTRVSGLFSDDRLARRATGGDQQAFGAIFRRYHQRLYRYCLAVVGNPEDAQDALQNTMIKVLRALPGEERRIDLRPWLYRIAHNESIEVLRRRRETAQIDPELVAQGAGLAEEAEARERLRRLISDLDELPDRQRGALVMRELGGLDFAEIGAALDTSSAAARQTLYEARLGLGQMEAGREMSCETVTRALSEADGRVTRRRDIRAHLRSCPECRNFGEGIEARKRDLAAISPLPAVAAAGLLQGMLGGNAATGGLAGALGGSAVKSLGATAALKGAATVAVVGAIGVTAADRGGLIDAGLPGGNNGSQAIRSGPGAGGPGVGARHRAAESASSPIGDGAGAAIGEAGGKGAGRAAALKRRQARIDAAATPGSKGHREHPSGGGHEKRLPSASEHGQRTAAGHRATPQGQAQPAEPPKPAQPPKPPPTGRPAGPSHERAVPATPAPPPASQAKAPKPAPEPKAKAAPRGRRAGAPPGGGAKP